MPIKFLVLGGGGGFGTGVGVEVSILLFFGGGVGLRAIDKEFVAIWRSREKQGIQI